jgi:hypothetical protein
MTVCDAKKADLTPMIAGLKRQTYLRGEISSGCYTCSGHESGESEANPERGQCSHSARTPT